MTRSEHLVMLICMWLCLFPLVTAIVYLDMMLAPTWPVWSRTMVATAVAVPVMIYLVRPNVMKMIARHHGMTVQEYEIACCDPERRA